MQKPLNIAHRGGAGLWPENTLFALGQAARAGYDGAEIDVQLTRDGKPVCFHDFQLSPALCRDQKGKWLRCPRGGVLPLIRELFYAELLGLDVGRVKPHSRNARIRSPRTPHDGEHIPLLSEVIATVRSFSTHFRLFIELKTSYEDRSLSAAPGAVAEAVIEALRRTRFLEHAVLVGFDWPGLIRARQLEPRLECWFTTKRRRRSPQPAPWAGGFDPAKSSGIAQAIAQAGGQGWFCSRQEVSAKAVQSAREHGLKFGVWTVNATRDMRALTKLGVDAICTDRPDRLAKAWIKSRHVSADATIRKA